LELKIPDCQSTVCALLRRTDLSNLMANMFYLTLMGILSSSALAAPVAAHLKANAIMILKEY